MSPTGFHDFFQFSKTNIIFRTSVNGVETVKTYENDVLKAHTVNGQHQALQQQNRIMWRIYNWNEMTKLELFHLKSLEADAYIEWYFCFHPTYIFFANQHS